MVFYKNVSDLSEKISKLARDEKLRKSIGKKGKEKYMKYKNHMWNISTMYLKWCRMRASCIDNS